jgi:hypothetical protein
VTVFAVTKNDSVEASTLFLIEQSHNVSSESGYGNPESLLNSNRRFNLDG